MYAFVSGILDSAVNGVAVVDCNGIGYEINVSSATMNKLPAPGKNIKLYTYLHVREDAMELFGFLTSEEKELYEILISVSGVGPKVGLAILSTLEPNSFIHAVISGDAKAVAKAPGVGPKLAQRIILELKDKFKGYGVADAGIEVEMQSDGANEAIEALNALGYTISEATRAVAGLEGTVEQIVGQALKNLMRRG